MDDLFKKKTIKPSTKVKQIKEGRLKKALKINMMRRKNQSRSRLSNKLAPIYDKSE